jgi:pimeloyl-ACP methyl ester carboxylesterase
VWALVGSGAVGAPGTPEELAAWTNKAAAEFRQHGWENLIKGFEAQEPEPVPEWMIDRIRATDVEQWVNFVESLVDWNWDEWDVLPHLQTPTLFLTGELEDRDREVADMVSLMPRAEVLYLPGMGHLNAFLATTAVLPRVTEFLARSKPD